jgi:hypothetical protein
MGEMRERHYMYVRERNEGREIDISTEVGEMREGNIN